MFETHPGGLILLSEEMRINFTSARTASCVTEQFVQTMYSESEIKSTVEILVLAVLFVLAETLIFLRQPVFAFFMYISLLLVLLVKSRITSTSIAVYQSFVLLAVFRIVDLGLPAQIDDPLVRSTLVYAPMALAVTAVLFRSRSVDIRVNPSAFYLIPVVLLIGTLMGGVEYIVLRPESILSDISLARLSWFLLSIGVMVAYTEELLFRGLLHGAVLAELGVWQGRLVSSLVFAAFHSIFFDLLAICIGFAFGVIYAIFYDNFEDITTVIFLHFTINVLLFGFLPLWWEGFPTGVI